MSGNVYMHASVVEDECSKVGARCTLENKSSAHWFQCIRLVEQIGEFSINDLKVTAQIYQGRLEPWVRFDIWWLLIVNVTFICLVDLEQLLWDCSFELSRSWQICLLIKKRYPQNVNFGAISGVPKMALPLPFTQLHHISRNQDEIQKMLFCGTP